MRHGVGRAVKARGNGPHRGNRMTLSDARETRQEGWGRLRRRLRAWRGWLLVIAGAAAALGVWWARQPATYRLHKRIPVCDETLFPCENGFLLHQSPRVFVLRDWQGDVRWSFLTKCPLPHVSCGPGHPPASGWYGISPDGRTFAAVMLDGAGVRLQTWRDGMPTCDRLLPELPSRWNLHLLVLINGDVFVWSHRPLPPHPVVVVRGKRAIARGVLPGRNWMAVAPDGSAVAWKVKHYGDTFYAPIMVTEGQLATGQARKIAGSLAIGCGGRVATEGRFTPVESC